MFWSASLLHCVEIGGKFKRVIQVVKVWHSARSKDISFFDIAKDRIKLDAALTNCLRIRSGPLALRKESAPKSSA